MAGKNGSTLTKVEERQNGKPQPADIYTPPGREKRGDATTARYLITEYDKPLDPVGDEHTELLLALHEAAKLFRKEAMKWRDEIDWSGVTGKQSEADIEDRFGGPMDATTRPRL